MSLVAQWSSRSSPATMASFTFLLNIAFIGLALKIVYGTVNHVPMPVLDPEEYWGPGTKPAVEDTSINNFTITFNASMISDLKNRLINHRPFHAPLEGIAFEYGFNTNSLELWRQYLLNDYPFEERVTFLNQFRHYTTIIQGLKMHFMRATAENVTSAELTPLMILHGWPGSIREFYETVPYLLSIGKANGLAFDIIMPSLPGFTYSEGAAKPGLGVDKAAVICRNLMHRLGYPKFYVQGGDMGALVSSYLVTFYPTEALGYHTNFPLVHNGNIIFRQVIGNYHQEEMAEPDLLWRMYPSWAKFTAIVGRTGYLHLQSTKPDTFGIGLSDSPLGLMSHTLITTGVPNNTGTVSAVQLLDNWVIYWTTNCATTAMRLYAETFNKRNVWQRVNDIRTPVPTWVMQAPNETIYLPEFLLKMKFTNLLNVSLPVTGGHFFAWSKPDEFAADVVKAVVAFKAWHVMNSTMYSNCSMYISD